MTRFRMRLFMALVCIAFLPLEGEAAQPDYPALWPATDVTFTVPFNPGSETDQLFSLVQEAFTVKTGKKMTARHVPGKAGTHAWARIIDDAPDGSVLTAMVLPDAHLRTMQRDSGLDFEAIAICHVIASMPAALWTKVPETIASVDEIANAAASGNFTVAGPGSYSVGQLAARALDRQLGIRTLYIPYTGTVTAAKAVLDKRAELFWGYSVRVILSKPGKTSFRPLAIAAANRLPALPDTPTFKELGLNVEEGVYIAIAVPAETPEITREEISEYFTALAGDLTFQAKLGALGFVPQNIGLRDIAGFLAEMKRVADEKAQDFSLHDQ
jgi:Uncharacterized protein conserved in bacteria